MGVLVARERSRSELVLEERPAALLSRRERVRGARLARFGSLCCGRIGLGLALLSVFVAGLWFAAGAGASQFANGKILFTSERDGNSEIYRMDANGSNVTRLTNNTVFDAGAVWAPDGTKIAFTTNSDGNNEVYVIGADGSNPTNLTNHPSADAAAAWSPDGTKIAFQSNRADVNIDIYVMNADGSSGQNPTNLTNDPGGIDIGPEWSPDGAKITWTGGPLGSSGIFTMNAADGSNRTRLTQGGGANAFSPDGTKIAFFSTVNDNTDVYVMGADGSNPTKLTNHSAWDGSSTFSPDGSKIAFVTNRDGNYEIYVMNADGSNPTKLTSNVDRGFRPSWQAIPNTCANNPPCGPDIAVSQPGGVQAEAQSGTDQLDTTVTVPLAIKNNGPLDAPDTTLNWSVYEGAGDCSTQSDTPWMSAAEQLEGGESAGETSPNETDVANVALDASALPAGTYSTVLCITSDDPDEQVTSVPVKFTVQPKPVIQPPAPAAPPPAAPLPPVQIAAKDTTAPTLTLLTVSKAKFRAGEKVSFSFRLSEPARVTVSIKRQGNRKALGTLSARGQAGKNKISFTGKLKNRKLARGKYVAEMVAVDASGNRSSVKKKAFEIRR